MAASVGSFTLTTNVTPPLTLDASSGEGASSWIGQLLQPRIEGAFVGVPVDYAPYGPPNPAIGTFVLAAVVVLLGIGVLSVLRTLGG